MARPDPVELRRVAEALIAGDYADEAEGDRLIAWFNDNCPHPDGSDLIFWPDNGKEPTADEVVAKAMAYEPAQIARQRTTVTRG